MALIDCSGKPVVRGQQVGRVGGEGTVHEAVSHPGHVLKIYHEPADSAKASKLEHMKRQATPEILSFAAWPRHLVWDQNKKSVVGFIMPKVQGLEIHQIYSFKERMSYFPQVRWDFLIQVAINCAQALQDIHRLGVVIGDINEGNILVKNNATISLIDCDSFQAIHANGYAWTCDVGIAHWTPPELQSAPTFRGVVRTVNHDRFGLALLVFHLLFMARHPFSGSRASREDVALEKAIARFDYFYSSVAVSRGLRPPPHSLAVGAMPSGLPALFERAFHSGSERAGARPAPSEWVLALSELAKSLVVCRADKAHRYPGNLAACPWCAIHAQGGPNFFVSGEAIPASHVTGGIWQRIEAAVLPPLRFIGVDAMPKIACTPAAVPQSSEQSNDLFYNGFWVIGFAVLLLLFGAWPLSILLLVAAVIMMSRGPNIQTHAPHRRSLTNSLNDKKTQRQRAVEGLSQLHNKKSSELASMRAALKTKYERLINLSRERSEELRKLEADKQQAQLRAFLDTKFIAKAAISGIGPSLQATLRAHGVETALDVIGRMQVPGIGPVKLRALLDWRAYCTTKFRFDPSKPVPQSEINGIMRKYGDLQQQLEAQLKGGPGQLQSVVTAYRQAEAAQVQAIANLHQQCCQLEVDLTKVPTW
jgi:DNA-binding helix-hairpin-helix protein with protein kinase domain